MKDKLTKRKLEIIVRKSTSIANVCRLLNLKPAGGNYSTIKKYLKKWDISTIHFKGQSWSKGKKLGSKKSLPELFKMDSNYSSYKLKKRIFKEKLKKRKCESCKKSRWLNKPIPLELHHINGIPSDNRFSNLQILCPNCHALTDNYRGKNKKPM